MNLSAAFKINMGIWRKIAKTAIGDIKARTQAGIDREGKRFPPYSESYADLKSEGFQVRKPGKRFQAGQPTSSRSRPIGGLDRQVTPPNFRLRGLTMRDLSPIAITKDAAVIGWRNEFAQIVATQEEKKKYKVGGVDPKSEKRILDMLDQFFVGQWNGKVKNETVIIKV